MEQELTCVCGNSTFAILSDRARCPVCGKEYRFIVSEGQMGADAPGPLATLDLDAMNTVEHIAG